MLTMNYGNIKINEKSYYVICRDIKIKLQIT